MKPFEELTERGQVRRLRRLAEAALPQYRLGDAQLTFVAYSENAVFRVETHSQWTVYRQALLDGYASLRPFPKEQSAHLDLFMAARHVTEMLWAIDMAQSNPGFREGLDEWLEWAALHVARYLEKKEAL